MWAPILLFSIVGLTVADNGWRAGTKYTYQIYGRTLTGIYRESNQYAGVLMRATLLINADSDEQLTLQVEEAEYADINQHLSSGWSSNIPDEQVVYKQFALEKSPFQLYLKNGVVRKMVVQKTLPQWQINFYKAIASQFQVDTQAENLKWSKTNDIPQGDKQNGVFKTMEDSVNGIYETLYEIYPMPDYVIQSRPELVPLPYLRGNGRVYNIEKSRNFSNSEHHMIYRFGMSGHEQWKAGSNYMGNLLARTSGSRIVITGDLLKYTIQYSQTTEKVIVTPQASNSQKGITVSQMTAVLKTTEPLQVKSPAIDNPRTVQNLVYEYQKGQPRNVESSESMEDSSRSSSSSSSSTSSSENGSNQSEQNKGESENSNKFTRDRKTRSAEWMKPEMKTKHYRADSRSGSSSSSTSSSDEGSISSSEEYLSPQPRINSAPYIEFLPDNIVGEGAESGQIDDKIVKLAQNIGQSVLNPNNILQDNVLTSLSVLTRLISGANSQQLRQVIEKIYYPGIDNHESGSKEESHSPQDHQKWLAFCDALSLAGTGPALVTLNGMIKSGKVKGEQAAALVALLPTSSRYPTTEYMNYFFEMVKSNEIESQRFLNTSAIIAFTDLVRRSQVDHRSSQNRYSIHLSESKNHRSVVEEKYIPYFQNKLRNAIEREDSENSQVYIRALGNIAHLQVLSVYEPYLEGKYPTSNFQRLVMVASLDEMARLHPTTVGTVLYRIYQNQAETTEVRVAAVMMLMRMNPPAQLLQKMASQTNYDPNRHVNAAVKSTIESAARGEYNANPEMVAKARVAQTLLTPEQYGGQYCKAFVQSTFANQQNTWQLQHFLTYIVGQDGKLPSSIFYSLEKKINGYFKDPEVVSVMSSSSQDLIDMIMKQWQPQNKREQYSERDGSDYTYRKVFDTLKGEYEPQRQLEGNVQLSIFGAKRYLTFDNHTIEKIPNMIDRLRQSLKKGVNFQHSKFYNRETVEIGFPMAMGLRFTYSSSAPSYQYLRVKGKGDYEQPSAQNKSSFKVGFDGQYQYLQTYQRRTKLAFVFGQQRYVAGFEKIAQAYIPLEGKWQLNGENNSFQASLKPLNQDNEPQKLFQYRTNAYTTYQNTDDVKPYLEGPNVKEVQPESTKTYQKSYGKEQTGHTFQVLIQSEKSLQDIVNRLKGLDYIPTNYLNLMTHLDDSVTKKYYAISYNPQKSTNQETVINLSFRAERRGNEESSGYGANSNTSPPRARLMNYHASGNMARPSSVENRVEELSKNAKTGIQDGEARVIDASVSFSDDQNKGQYSLTVAQADSPVSKQSRYLMFYRGVPLQRSSNDEGLQAAVEVNLNKPWVSVMNYRDAMNAEPTANVEGKVNFGQGDDSMISFQGKMERSEKRKQYVKEHLLYTQCDRQMEKNQYWTYSCLNASKAAGFYDKYELSAKYQNVPKQLRRSAYALYSMWRRAAFEYSAENVVDVKNQEGKIDIGIQLSEDLTYLNVSIEAPDMTSRFENIWLDKFIQKQRYGQISHLTDEVYNWQKQGVCSLDATTVTTFNNKSFPANLGDCYHVIAMYTGSQELSDDDNGKNNFAILMKENDSHRKIMKIVLGDNVVTLKPSGAVGGTVDSNGNEIQISESSIARWKLGQHEVQAYVLSGGSPIVFLQLVNHGIEVNYDGNRAQVLIPNTYRNRVRGLCGTFDGEPVNDFTTPKNCVMKNYQHFTASYALADSTCRGPAMDLHLQAENAPCYIKQVLPADVISEAETGRRNGLGTDSHPKKNKTDPKSQQGCNNHKVSITEADGKTCFSIKPQLTCNSNCRPEGTVEKTIQFHCMNESSATRHWVTMVKKGANPDFSQKKSNHQKNLRLPEKCVPIQ